MNSRITFISNNVKGIQKSVKRITFFEYLKNCHWRWVSFFSGNAFLYKQRNQVEERVQRRALFLHGKTNSCKVAIEFYGSKTIEQTSKISDK